MKNLMTRKIVLGMLMVLVLAFSVQGIAEALSALTQSGLEADLSTPKIFATTITLNLTPALDRDNIREAVTVTV